MKLDDLLADVEGIGEDRYIPSTDNEEASPVSDSAPQRIADIEPQPSSGEEKSSLDSGEIARRLLSEDVVEAHQTLGSLDMVLDVEFELTVRLGQATLSLNELMALQPGAQFALEQHPDSPLDIFVNNQFIARGEALIVDGTLAVQIVELLHEGEE